MEWPSPAGWAPAKLPLWPITAKKTQRKRHRQLYHQTQRALPYDYLEALGISGASIRDAESKTKVENWLKKIGFEKETANEMTMNITASGKTFKAEIEDNETGKAFLEKLPLTLDMSELNGNEKYCYGVDLPRSDKHYDSIAAGDLMLYSGNCIVLFYGSAGGYSYTKIGKLANTDGLAEALGDGSIKVTYSR